MKITDVNAVGGARPIGKKKKTPAGGDFGSLLDNDNEVESGTNVGGINPIAPLGNILAAQETGSFANMDEIKQQLSRGNNMLDYLSELRDGMLTGSTNPQNVQKLVDELRKEKNTTPDPQLSELLDEIELRAAVELAKLE